jgi:hypothetical protein
MASHENMMLYAQAAMRASNSFYNTQGGIEETSNLPNLGKRVNLMNGSTKNLPTQLQQMQATYTGGVGNPPQTQSFSNHLQAQQQ